EARAIRWLLLGQSSRSRSPIRLQPTCHSRALSVRGEFASPVRFRRRSTLSRFSPGFSSVFLRKGFVPSRKGPRAQSTATHFRTSDPFPQQQSRHFFRMALRGFCALNFWERNCEGTSPGCLPTSSPSSACKGDISRRCSFCIKRFPHHAG